MQDFVLSPLLDFRLCSFALYSHFCHDFGQIARRRILRKLRARSALADRQAAGK
jgi:hypothetical protein